MPKGLSRDAEFTWHTLSSAPQGTIVARVWSVPWAAAAVPGRSSFTGGGLWRCKDRTQQDWPWFTYTRVRLLNALADRWTEREIAERLGVEYVTVPSGVEDLKNKIGISNVREIGRWWDAHRKEWLAWCANLGGIDWRDAG